LAIDQSIVGQVNFAEELELATQALMKKIIANDRGDVNLGGLLGFVVGLLQKRACCCWGASPPGGITGFSIFQNT